MPKTIIVISLMRFHGVTGVQTHMREFAAFLSSRQHPHVVLAPDSFSKALFYSFVAFRLLLERLSPDAGVRFYRSGHAFLLKLALQRHLRHFDECTIYAQCPVSAKVAMDLSTGRRDRVVMINHFNVSQADEWVGKGMIETEGPTASAIRRFEDDVLPKLDGVVCVSKFMRDILLKRMPTLSSANIQVIPNFVNEFQGQHALQHDAQFTRDFVSIGTLEARKNQGFLLKLIAHALSKGHRWTLTLVGDGPDRKALEHAVVELGISEQVQFVGHDPLGRRWLHGHKAYIHAAHMENLCIVMLEAMSEGMPVLGPKVGGVPEIIDDGITGYFINLNDVELTFDVCRRLISNPVLLQEVGANSLAKFNAAFNSAIVANRLLNYLCGDNVQSVNQKVSAG
jgi:glycosyltransferase involved in cell wall biosynthesis